MKDSQNKVFFHVDVNSAYLSWESCERQRQNPNAMDLRTIPSAIGGDPTKRHGIILAKSALAKSYGIYTSEPIHSALRKCPNLVLVPPNHALYKKYSNQLMELLKSYAPNVEPFSIDEAFCDMTHTSSIYGEPIQAAHQLKEKILCELGFTVNIGISSNKILAKMASDFKKPNQIHTLFPDEVEQKLWSLPVRRLFLVGRSTERKLKELGIYTIGDLARTDVKFLRAHLNKHGEILFHYAHGLEYSFLDKNTSSAKGYSNETTLTLDVEDEKMAKWFLLSLSESVCQRMRVANVLGTTLFVTITYHDFTRSTHQITILTPTNTSTIFYETICQLFDELWNGKPIRLLGCGASKITDNTSIQLNFFDNERSEKLKNLDLALDSIRNKFGSQSIMRASFMNHSQKKSEE